MNKNKKLKNIQNSIRDQISKSKGVAFFKKRKRRKRHPKVKANQLDFLSRAATITALAWIFVCVISRDLKQERERESVCSLQPQPRAWQRTDAGGICTDWGAQVNDGPRQQNRETGKPCTEDRDNGKRWQGEAR